MGVEKLRRYTFYLKDGRVASVVGARLDPNVDRLFQGQTRNFIIVTDGEGETGVFLAGDVIGWTLDELGAERSVVPQRNGSFQAHTTERDAADGGARDADPIRAFLES